MSEIHKLEKTISSLQEQRHILGDDLLNIALAPLQERLAFLVSQQKDLERQRKQVSILVLKIFRQKIPCPIMDKDWTEQSQQVIKSWGGTVEHDMDDHMIISWGLNEVREDNPERAIRAGLELKRITQNLFATDPNQEHEELSCFFKGGIHTQQIILGQSKKPQDSAAYQQIIQLTRDLADVCPANGLVISRDTYSNVQGVFNINQLPLSLSDAFSKPLDVYYVQGAKPRAFRIPTRGVEGIQTRTVGQDEHLKTLLTAWNAVLSLHNAHTCTIIGEAGLGKSRLMDDMRTQLEYRGEPFYHFEGRSTPQTDNLPYALVRDIISNRFQIYSSDTPEVARQKLVAGFAEFMDEDSAEKAHLVGQLLGFDFSESPHIRGILNDASQIHQRAQQYLIDFFTSTTNLLTTAVFLDNIQWADNASLNLLKTMASGLRDQPFMLVIIARPSLLKRFPDWGDDLPNQKRIVLNPLSLTESHELIADILQRMEFIPQILSETIAKGSAGNPYYIEEIIKYLVDDGVIIPDEPYWQLLPEKLVTSPIPTTISDIITARNNRLSPQEREIIQAASVIGRIFWDSMVDKLVNGIDTPPNPTILNVLETLQKHELVFRRPTSSFDDAEEYVFKHHLLHDITYSSVPPDQKELYHTRAAEWLQRIESNSIDEYSSWIAYHLGKTSKAHQAGQWYLRAGLIAARQFANEDAAWFFSRAFDLLPETQIKDRFQALELKIKTNSLLNRHEQTRTDLEQLTILSGLINDPLYSSRTYFAQASFENALGNSQESIQLCEKALDITHGLPPEKFQVQIIILKGTIYHNNNNLVEAHRAFSAAYEMSSRLNDDQVSGFCLRQLGNICWQLRNYEEGLNYLHQSLEYFEKIKDLRGTSQTHLSIGVIQVNQKNIEKGYQHYKISLDLCKRIGEKAGIARILNNMGDIETFKGNFDDAIEYFKQALVMYTAENQDHGIAISLANLGFTSLMKGAYSASLDYYQQWFNFSQALPDPRGMAWACTGLAQILIALGQYGRSRNYLNQAMTFFSANDDEIGKSRTLSLLAHCVYISGDLNVAIGYASETTNTNVTPENYDNLFLAHLTLGYIYTDMGKFEQAHKEFESAERYANFERDKHLSAEPETGMARLALKENNIAHALGQIQPILQRIMVSPLNRSEFIFETYLTCVNILAAAGDPRLPDILYRAQNLLFNLAGNISDPDLRKSFLENVPVNRKLASYRLV